MSGQCIADRFAQAVSLFARGEWHDPPGELRRPNTSNGEIGGIPSVRLILPFRETTLLRTPSYAPSMH